MWGFRRRWVKTEQLAIIDEPFFHDLTIEDARAFCEWYDACEEGRDLDEMEEHF